MKYYPFFETERLKLHAVTKADAPHQLAIMNTPKWLKNIGDRKVYTVEEAEKYIAKKITPQFNRLGFGNYKVIRKSDGKFLGNCGLYDRPELEGVDIGFAFLPHYEKKGYAFESAQKLKEEAFSTFGIKTISAITIPSNLSSQKLLEKLGLSFVKMIRLPNDDEELMFYQIHNQEI
jgi:Acetyltransferases, including N-acetylases of ribosomal proteins